MDAVVLLKLKERKKQLLQLMLCSYLFSLVEATTTTTTTTSGRPITFRMTDTQTKEHKSVLTMECQNISQPQLFELQFELILAN